MDKVGINYNSSPVTSAVVKSTAIDIDGKIHDDVSIMPTAENAISGTSAVANPSKIETIKPEEDSYLIFDNDNQILLHQGVEYKLYENEHGTVGCVERKIDANSRIKNYSAEEALKLGSDYTSIALTVGKSSIGEPLGVGALKARGTVQIKNADGSETTYLGTEDSHIFKDSKTGKTIFYDDENNKLMSVQEARTKFDVKYQKALELINKNGHAFAQKVHQSDVSKELQRFGANNIVITTQTIGIGNEATGAYDNNPEKNNTISKALFKFYQQKVCSESKVACDMDADSYFPTKNGKNHPQIVLPYTNMVNSSPEEIAETLVHELGHAKDNDEEDSIQEEADVETRAQNFESFLKSPKHFKYKTAKNDEEMKNYMEDFLTSYKEYPATSTHHEGK